MRRVLSEPLFWIATNAGYDGKPRSTRCAPMPEGPGSNALTGEFGDLFENGVIDPVRVTRLTLENAASVAALLLTTEAIVAEELIAQPGAIIAPGLRRPRGGPGAARPRSDRPSPEAVGPLLRARRGPAAAPARGATWSPGHPSSSAGELLAGAAGGCWAPPRRAAEAGAATKGGGEGTIRRIG